MKDDALLVLSVSEATVAAEAAAAGAAVLELGVAVSNEQKTFIRYGQCNGIIPEECFAITIRMNTGMI